MTDPRKPSSADHLAAAIDSPELEELRARVQAQLDDYQLLTCLGRGGMGAVFRAHHLRLDRPVAVKVLLPAPEAATGWEERFLREARALARLAHPGIVTVYDYGQAEDLCWIVMEFVDGANLRELMSDGRLQPAEALAIVPQICAALQYAHDQGVVHRDVKPENVLLDEAGRVRIADFGLAKLMDAGLSAQLTGSDQALGTLRYMAPEQLERPGEVDHRADIFSLGVVFYEMLTGQVPAGAVQPPSAEGCPDPRLDEVVMKSMQREPDERFQRVDEVGQRLDDLQDAPPVATPRGQESMRTRLRYASIPVAVVAVCTLVAQWGQLHGDTYSGFETPMGLLTAATLAGIALVLVVLADHRRGRTAAVCQLLLSPLAIMWPMAHVMNAYGARDYPMSLATAGLAGVLTLLGLLQLIVREPGERTLATDVDRARTWVGGKDLWPWACMPVPALGLLLLASNNGYRLRENNPTGWQLLLIGLLVSLWAPIGLRRTPSQRRIAGWVQLCLGIVLANVAQLSPATGAEGAFVAVGLASSVVAGLRLYWTRETRIS